MSSRNKKLADDKGIILAGRLGTYTYLDMDKCIEQAFSILESIKERLYERT